MIKDANTDKTALEETFSIYAYPVRQRH